MMPKKPTKEILISIQVFVVSLEIHTCHFSAGAVELHPVPGQVVDELALSGAAVVQATVSSLAAHDFQGLHKSRHVTFPYLKSTEFGQSAGRVWYIYGFYSTVADNSYC